jgi:hypothetical protein
MAAYQVFYTFRDKVSSYFLDADSAIEAMEKLPRFYPQIKTAFKAQRVYTSKAVQDELSFTWTKEIVAFIYAMVDGKVRMYVEGNSDVSKEIEDKYQELTGEVLVPKKGVYNIAPDAKWGTEGTVYYGSIPFPEDFGLEPEKSGQVNSTKLFWVLIRMGFRLEGAHHTHEIENSIPAELRRVAGVA